MRKITVASVGGALGAAVWMACSSSSPGEAPAQAEAGTQLDASNDVIYDRAPYDGVSTPLVQRVPVRIG